MSSSNPLIVIPTYKEVENLPEFTQKLWGVLPQAKLLVVDDASGDGTPAWVQKHKNYGVNLFLLERNRKLGLGSAYIAGFTWALEFHSRQRLSAIIQMDADLSHDPASLPDFLSKIECGFDLVLGTRYRDGGGIKDWPPSRLVLSRGAALYVKMLTGMPFSDPTGGYKAFRPEALDQIDFKEVESDGYSFQIEMTFMGWHSGWKIAEVPIQFEGRHAGSSKMSARIVREAIWMVPWLAVKPKKNLLPKHTKK